MIFSLTLTLFATLRCHRNYMPFVLVSAPSNAQIDVKLRDTQDKLHVKMNCPFQLHNDNSIIGVMNLCPVKEELLHILGSRALVNFIISRYCSLIIYSSNSHLLMHFSRPDLFPTDDIPEVSDTADSSMVVAVAPPTTLRTFSTASVEAPVTPTATSLVRKHPSEGRRSSIKKKEAQAAHL
jgi:hypothetical protein